MWNPENHLIKFIPETEWTDPSYHLPHFYEVFAERADEADRPFWAQAAKAEPRVPGHRLPPADRHEPRILELRRHAARRRTRPLALLL